MQVLKCGMAGARKCYGLWPECYRLCPEVLRSLEATITRVFSGFLRIRCSAVSASVNQFTLVSQKSTSDSSARLQKTTDLEENPGRATMPASNKIITCAA